MNKCEINDVIYFLYQNKITKRPIICKDEYKDATRNISVINYKILFESVIVLVNEKDCFKSKDELIKHLLNESKLKTIFTDKNNGKFGNHF